jgi:hypothetical protein
MFESTEYFLDAPPSPHIYKKKLLPTSPQQVQNRYIVNSVRLIVFRFSHLCES